MINKYPKINTIFKRDRTKRIILGDLSDPAFGAVCLWQYTEKLDGQNIRVRWDGNQVRIDGRTDDADLPYDLMDLLYEKFNVKTMLRQFNDDVVALYGEGFGPGIGKGGELYGDKPRFAIFDAVFGGKLWARQNTMRTIAGQMSVEIAPVVGEGWSTDSGLLFVEQRPCSIAATYDREMEGIVARPTPELFQQDGKLVMWKIKAHDFHMLETRPVE